jgi:hypothetical protein
MFLTDDELSSNIRELVGEGGSRCAVAFIGKEAEGIVPPGTQIICNLMSGATNPATIEHLMKNGECEIRKLDDLHAKVYLGRDRAIVGSANLSANGLGYEPATGSGGWQEAGYKVTRKSDLEKIEEWFAEKWESAEAISSKDITEAKKRWALRQRFRPANKSYEEYVENGGAEIMLAWTCTDEKWVVTKTGKKAASQAGKQPGTETVGYIEDSIEITVEDKNFFKPGTWVLRFEADEDGRVPVGPIKWFQCGAFIDNAYKFRGQEKERPVVVRSPVEVPGPFPLTREFKRDFAKRMEAFIESQGDDSDLIYEDFSPGFYKENQDYFVLQNFMKLPLK